MSHYRRARVAGGTYFFTVALERRDSALLVEHVEALRAAYRKTAQDKPFTTLAICVLPDHLHTVWQLPEGDADFPLRWAAIKSAFSHGLPPAAERSASKQARREKGLWQRRFWEHQVRDEEDLRRHLDYVHFNPVKHGLVKRVAEWPYSSFHRYVKAGDLDEDWAGAVDDLAGYGEPGYTRVGR
jgi:putative transposase